MIRFQAGIPIDVARLPQREFAAVHDCWSHWSGGGYRASLPIVRWLTANGLQPVLDAIDSVGERDGKVTVASVDRELVASAKRARRLARAEGLVR